MSSNIHIQDKGKELLLTSLSDFYNKNEKYKNILISIINSKYILSLRLIDWLVTHYAKANNIIFWISMIDNNIYDKCPQDIEDYNKYKKVNIYLDYRAQLKSYTKFKFDSFRRHDRITFIIDKNKGINIETTIGQLNFFRWAFNNNILDYAIKHKKEIYSSMLKKTIKEEKNTIIPKQDIINAKCFLRFD